MAQVEEQTRTLTIYDHFPVLGEIKREKRFPRHLLIIPDGNRRFAREAGLNPLDGHAEGLSKTLLLLRQLRELPIEFVTLWAFSADNWGRPKEEVSGLMQLLEMGIATNLQELNRENARLYHLGRKDRIPESLSKTLTQAQALTARNTGQTVCLAIDYGGEDQEVRISQKIAKMAIEHARVGESLEITPQLRRMLSDGGFSIPDVDLLIRTSGEMRTSDFGSLAGKAELYFWDGFYPSLTTENLVEALKSYAKRDRRFGK